MPSLRILFGTFVFDLRRPLRIFSNVTGECHGLFLAFLDLFAGERFHD
jgi:hypothetical protein